MTTTLKPKALVTGDTIAFVAPASGVAGLVPHRLEQGKKFFESKGFKVKIYPSVIRTPKENAEAFIDEKPLGFDPEVHVSDAPTYSSADAIIRAKELMQAFKDPEVKAIVCTIGGVTSHEMLEYLDFDIIKSNPKIFCGFSDITTLHMSLYKKTGLVTFYGPSVICQFGEFPTPCEYTTKYFFREVCDMEPVGDIEPSDKWTDDKKANWFTKADITHVREMKPNPGFVWIREGKATGRLFGGCLPVFRNVAGSQYSLDFMNTILLLEAPQGYKFDEGFEQSELNAHLGYLRVDGTLRNVRGIVFGRAFKYGDQEVGELIRLVKYHTRGYDIPIVYGVDIGHSDPMLTLPLGTVVTLDSIANRFVLEESGVC